MVNNIPEFKTYDYPIGGKLVVGKTVMTEAYKIMMQDGDPDAKKRVKSEIIYQMLEFVLDNNLVEFTFYDEPLSMNRHVAVRAYLAPNDQVRILRLANKI